MKPSVFGFLAVVRGTPSPTAGHTSSSGPACPAAKYLPLQDFAPATRLATSSLEGLGQELLDQQPENLLIS